jgi:hypothetical protein
MQDSVAVPRTRRSRRRGVALAFMAVVAAMALSAAPAVASGPQIVPDYGISDGWLHFVNVGDTGVTITSYAQIVSGDLFTSGRDPDECGGLWPTYLPPDGEDYGCRIHFGGGAGDVAFPVSGLPDQVVYVDTSLM